MEENRQTRSEQEIARRDRVREGRCVLQHVTTQFCKIDFSNKKISKKKCHFSVDFSHFRLISSHILIGGRLHEEFEMGNPIFKKAGHQKNVEGAPNILGTPSWIVFRRDER